jgi:hypothetical protein
MMNASVGVAELWPDMNIDRRLRNGKRVVMALKCCTLPWRMAWSAVIR